MKLLLPCLKLLYKYRWISFGREEEKDPVWLHLAHHRFNEPLEVKKGIAHMW